MNPVEFVPMRTEFQKHRLARLTEKVTEVGKVGKRGSNFGDFRIRLLRIRTSIRLGV